MTFFTNLCHFQQHIIATKFCTHRKISKIISIYNQIFSKCTKLHSHTSGTKLLNLYQWKERNTEAWSFRGEICFRLGHRKWRACRTLASSGKSAFTAEDSSYNSHIPYSPIPVISLFYHLWSQKKRTSGEVLLNNGRRRIRTVLVSFLWFLSPPIIKGLLRKSFFVYRERNQRKETKTVRILLRPLFKRTSPEVLFFWLQRW